MVVQGSPKALAALSSILPTPANHHEGCCPEWPCPDCDDCWCVDNERCCCQCIIRCNKDNKELI